jgi:hypothetical protein
LNFRIAPLQACRFNAVGRCRFGDRCKFSHEDQLQNPLQGPNRILPLTGGRSALCSISGNRELQKLHTFPRPASVQSSEVHLAILTDIREIGSYSWVQAQTPTIAIPGTFVTPALGIVQ